jgi:hypothetical protein
LKLTWVKRKDAPNYVLIFLIKQGKKADLVSRLEEDDNTNGEGDKKEEESEEEEKPKKGDF